MLTVLDLFSGIGGFSLGLERTGGFKTVAFCEIDPFCRKVLAKHWPEVPCYDDIRALTAARLAADGIGTAAALAHTERLRRAAAPQRGGDSAAGGNRQNDFFGDASQDAIAAPLVDVVCGGFPCQDISTAGKGAGISGERSGLWVEMCRVIGEVRPRYAIVENVSALLGRGLGTVLGDLAAIGYDTEWHCIPASALNAPHRRDRIWIIAHRNGTGLEGWQYTNGMGQEQHQGALGQGGPVHDPTYYAALSEGIGRGEPTGLWRSEPDVGRVAHGVPRRVDRLRALGNAVVPQIPELIGRAILAQHGLS